MKNLALIVLGFWSLNLPTQPQDAEHPGSDFYEYEITTEKLKIDGRSVEVVYPLRGSFFEAPLVIFGHGQALGFNNYKATFEHLAKKGVVVIHPKYDNGFFDQNWRKMASSYNSLSQKALEHFSEKFRISEVVYSGHSKGGYVGLMAAGAPNRLRNIKSSLMFAPAGYDKEYLESLDPSMSLTLIWSDEDSIIERTDVEEIYKLAPLNLKQMVIMKSYPDKRVGHFFPLTKRSAFGGESAPSALHFYGSWKWLTASALFPNDIQENPYLLGQEALSSGSADTTHTRIKNWNE